MEAILDQQQQLLGRLNQALADFKAQQADFHRLNDY